MKVGKGFAIAVCGYIGLVIAFESLIGVFQPEGGDTLVITTGAGDVGSADRVLSRLESGGQLYVAANHWPRSWYQQALKNPRVEVTIDGTKRPYLAVPATDAEHERISAEHDTGLLFRILTGFPPRYFLRLDPQSGSPTDPTGG